MPKKTGSLYSTLVIVTASFDASLSVYVSGQERQDIIGLQQPVDDMNGVRRMRLLVAF